MQRAPERFRKSKAVLKPQGYRVDAESAWGAFIMEAARGMSPSGLAKMFGLPVGKVERILRTPEAQAQVVEASRRLARVGDYARNKLLAAAPDLIEAQLEVALGREPLLGPDDLPQIGPDGEPLTRWSYDVKERMLAGRYCLDKIIPTITKVDDAGGGMSHDLALALKEVLVDLKKLPPAPPVLLSSHVYEGRDAVAKAIDVEIVDGPNR